MGPHHDSSFLYALHIGYHEPPYIVHGLLHDGGTHYINMNYRNTIEEHFHSSIYTNQEIGMRPVSGIVRVRLDTTHTHEVLFNINIIIIIPQVYQLSSQRIATR
jgi:hypothetical protein